MVPGPFCKLELAGYLSQVVTSQTTCFGTREWAGVVEPELSCLPWALGVASVGAVPGAEQRAQNETRPPSWSFQSREKEVKQGASPENRTRRAQERAAAEINSVKEKRGDSLRPGGQGGSSKDMTELRPEG